MIVNPGIRRFLGSAIQRLFNSASFYAPLTHTAVPQRAAPGTTATFTRATPKTVTNNDGYLVTLLAGEIGFPGARRVDNLIRLGAAQSSTLAIAANVTMTLPAGAYQFSMGAGTGTATFSGTGGATGTLAASASGRVFVAKTITAGTLIVTGSAAILNDIQVVSMVAETDQTTIREYVSVGVESAPYYHGSFVDGVRCFPTDLAGNALTTMRRYNPEGARTNLCLQSNAFNTTWLDSTTPTATQNVVGPDGATSAWTIADDDATNLEFKYQPILLTAAAYTASVFVKKTVGTQASYPVFRLSLQAGGASANCTIDTTNGIATAWTAFTGDAMLAGISASCSNYNDDFWRVSLTATATAANYVIILAPAATTNPVQSTGAWVGTVTGSAVFYGAQVELGSFASSYIPTTTIAVARNADVLTYSSAGNIDGTKGWCYAEVNGSNVSYLSTDGAYYVTSDTSSDSPILYNVPVPPGKLSTFDGTSIINGDAITANIKGCVSWGGTSRSISVNGGTPVSGAFDGAIITGSSIGIGHKVGGITSAYANIGPIYIGQRQLSASEMQAITAA